jgi:hypothetical protein
MTTPYFRRLRIAVSRFALSHHGRPSFLPCALNLALVVAHRLSRHVYAVTTKPKAMPMTIKKNTISAENIKGRITRMAATIHKTVEHIGTYGMFSLTTRGNDNFFTTIATKTRITENKKL